MWRGCSFLDWTKKHFSHRYIRMRERKRTIHQPTLVWMPHVVWNAQIQFCIRILVKWSVKMRDIASWKCDLFERRERFWYVRLIKLTGTFDQNRDKIKWICEHNLKHKMRIFIGDGTRATTESLWMWVCVCVWPIWCVVFFSCTKICNRTNIIIEINALDSFGSIFIVIEKKGRKKGMCFAWCVRDQELRSRPQCISMEWTGMKWNCAQFGKQLDHKNAMLSVATLITKQMGASLNRLSGMARWNWRWTLFCIMLRWTLSVWMSGLALYIDSVLYVNLNSILTIQRHSRIKSNDRLKAHHIKLTKWVCGCMCTSTYQWHTFFFLSFCVYTYIQFGLRSYVFLFTFTLSHSLSHSLRHFSSLFLSLFFADTILYYDLFSYLQRNTNSGTFSIYQPRRIYLTLNRLECRQIERIKSALRLRFSKAMPCSGRHVLITHTYTQIVWMDMRFLIKITPSTIYEREGLLFSFFR